jgi:hypothetical protein
MTKARKKSDGDIPVLREVVEKTLVEARAKRLPNMDLFADPSAGIPDPNALQHELAQRLEARVEELARQVMRDAERKLADRLKHELPALIEETLKNHFAKK